jgi:hypothetical protein
MRTAKTVIETVNQEVSLGRQTTRQIATYIMVEIENYGRTGSQDFINTLIRNGRLDYSFYKKRTQRFSDEFLTELLNKNEDLFPVQF